MVTGVTFIFSQKGKLQMAVFWDVAPCSPVEVYRRFRGFSASTIRAIKGYNIGI
jgi:hypothetical protein